MLFSPYWQQDLQHFGLTNFQNGQSTGLWKCILGKSVDPLLAVLRIFPSRQTLYVNLPCDLIKARYLLPPVVARIIPAPCQSPILQRSVACFVQRHDIRTTKPKVGAQWLAFAVALNLNCDANNPAPGTRWVGNEVQPAPVTMATGAEGSHQILCQLSAQNSHKIPRILTRNE